MARTTMAMVGWTLLWIVAVWAIDPASTVGGKPPAWALFGLWAAGIVLLGAVRAGVLGVGASRRVRLDRTRALTVPGAALLWTAAWMVVFPLWALDPRATEIGMGPGGPPPAMKPSEPLLYAAWLVGLAVLAGVWIVARARSNGLRAR